MIDIYARLSYAADGSEINVNEQIAMGTADVKRRGGRVGEVFRDNSKSGWSPQVVRPEWNALMSRLESGVSSGVWVLDLTRFSRKVIEGERLVAAAQNGRLVWSASGEYNLMSGDGREAFRTAMVRGAAESDKISERVRRGKRRRAYALERFQGGPRGFGLPGLVPAAPGKRRRQAGRKVVEAEREIVRDCYRRLLA